MKHFFSFFLLFMLVLAAAGQTGNPRLIVRGDDMGSSQAANRASLETALNGIETSVEVMVVGPWFPEAARMLRENPSIDVGIHLVITSEWDNIKWRPLTHCPSLTDSDGYFFPMIFPNNHYKGLSIVENDWNLQEIENEFRAQIELGLKNIPHASHISGHMGSTRFDEKVGEITRRLAAEYNLSDIDFGSHPQKNYTLQGTWYNGPKETFVEKESSFISMLDKLEAGKTYYFVDHPAYDNDEMRAVHHIGYENVAADRQGVTELFLSEKVKTTLKDKHIELVSYNEVTKALPRSNPADENTDIGGIENFLKGVEAKNFDLHSLMIVRNGKVIFEKWLGDHAPAKPHSMWSVSKTYTATAIGFAVAEGRLKVTDKVISFFPDKLPQTVSDNLKALEIRHLLTMSSGHDVEPRRGNSPDADWLEAFFAAPFEHKPGTFYVYNSMVTYVLSAIIQKVTGEKLIDYLYPRLFRPLGIAGATWSESPQGINAGGWGLSIKTEDMAKLGLFILQKGKWNGKQLLPPAWFDEATAALVESLPSGARKENLKMKPEDSDWLQGYGYQMWRCRHNAFRADGANGQFIIIIPDKNAVVAITANIGDMQAEINLVWDNILPALK